MPKWINADGLAVKFGSDEGDALKGGLVLGRDGIFKTEFTIDYTDALSATASVLGSASTTSDGALGIQIPKGARIKAVEVLVQTAFTSSGTIGSSTLVIGLKKWSDLSTDLSTTALTATGATGTVLGLATVGSRTYLTAGVTGAGAYIGTSLSESGIVSVANSAHSTNPFTAGKAIIRVEWFYP